MRERGPWGADVSTVDAGRELDALIAEKVMGHAVDYDRKWRDPSIIAPGAHVGSQPVPHYSTDIAAVEATMPLEPIPASVRPRCKA